MLGGSLCRHGGRKLRLHGKNFPSGLVSNSVWRAFRTIQCTDLHHTSGCHYHSVPQWAPSWGSRMEPEWAEWLAAAKTTAQLMVKLTLNRRVIPTQYTSNSMVVPRQGIKYGDMIIVKSRQYLCGRRGGMLSGSLRRHSGRRLRHQEKQ